MVTSPLLARLGDMEEAVLSGQPEGGKVVQLDSSFRYELEDGMTAKAARFCKLSIDMPGNCGSGGRFVPWLIQRKISLVNNLPGLNR